MTTKPSRYILQKAWKLGQKMAISERRIRPCLDGAHQYATYKLFVTTHRHRLQQLDAFVPWDQKIQRLIEREGNASGLPLDDPRYWDLFYTSVAGPIYAAFWYGWELVHKLEDLYRQEVVRDRSGRLQRPVVLHVAKALLADRRDDVEGAMWDRVATRLFDEMQVEDNPAFWDSAGKPAMEGEMSAVVGLKQP